MSLFSSMSTCCVCPAASELLKLLGELVAVGRARSPARGVGGSLSFQPKMLQSKGNLRMLFSECGETIPASFTCSRHLRQRRHFSLSHLLFLSMLIHRVVTCLAHRTLVFFHNITGQFPKKFHIPSDKEVFWFLHVFFMLFFFSCIVVFAFVSWSLNYVSFCFFHAWTWKGTGNTIIYI